MGKIFSHHDFENGLMSKIFEALTVLGNNNKNKTTKQPH